MIDLRQFNTGRNKIPFSNSIRIRIRRDVLELIDKECVKEFYSRSALIREILIEHYKRKGEVINNE